MNILHLPLKSKWYDMIESGVKPEEYRDIKPYWVKRFLWDEDYNGPLERKDAELSAPLLINAVDACCFTFRHYDFVEFTCGYPKKEDTSRRMTFEVVNIKMEMGNPEWGAPTDKEVFIIKLGKRVK